MTHKQLGRTLIIVGIIGMSLCIGSYLLFPAHFGNEPTSVIEKVVASVESETDENSTPEEILSSIENNCQKFSDNPERCKINLLKIYDKKMMKASVGAITHEA